MSADMLRQAAALIRERAQAATPGPWCFYNGDLWVGRADALAAFDASEGDESLWPYQCGERGQLFCGDPERPEDAAHIASWHPLVALAFASLLEHVAETIEEAEESGVSWARWDFAHAALAGACAYLGEERASTS